MANTTRTRTASVMSHHMFGTANSYRIAAHYRGKFLHEVIYYGASGYADGMAKMKELLLVLKYTHYKCSGIRFKLLRRVVWQS